MTALETKPEMIREDDEVPKKGIFVSRRAPRDLMELRAEFVKRKGWIDSNTSYTDDSDRYDQSLSTLHLFERDGDGTILAGMRLTEIDSVYNSLSVEMLQGNQRMHDEVLARADAIDAGSEGGGLWDLTRLVDAPGGDKLTKFKAVIEVFGAGMAATDRGNENLTWIFTTTEEVKNALDGVGIKNEELTRGFISKKDEEKGETSYVCVVRTIDAFRFLEENSDKPEYKFAYDNVVNGRDTLNTL
jgi:hypothetical protein